MDNKHQYQKKTVCERSTVRPVNDADFIRESGVVKCSPKNGKRLVSDGNLKGCWFAMMSGAEGATPIDFVTKLQSAGGPYCIP